MKISSKILYVVLFAVMFSVTTVNSTYAQGRNIPTLNKEMPDISLMSYSGEEVKLADYVGKKNVVLMTFRGWIGYW